MVRVPGQAGRPSEHLGIGDRRGKQFCGDQTGFAFGNGAGLVEGNDAQLAGLFEIDSTFDQDAASSRCRQPADHRHRRGEHQRAGASDDQQHQGLVERLRPGPAEEPRSQNGHGNRDGEHGRGVDCGKPIHEALGWRLRPLRLFDRVDDAGQCGVVGSGRDTELQDAGFVDRAGEYRVACHLINRDTFAGDRRLIDRTAACRHLTIERYSGAGFDPHTGFQLYLCGRHFPPRSIRLPDFRRLRRQVEQALDGVTRPIHGAGLDQFGNGIQGHDHRRLGPLADQEGTGHGHTHQRVHVQLPAPQCRHAFAIGRNAGQPDGDDGQCHTEALERQCVGREEIQRFRTDGQPQRQNTSP